MISSRFFESGEKSKMPFITLFLLAVLVSEVAVIFLLKHEAGMALSRALASQGAAGVGAFIRLGKWTYQMVGPMLFPLLILTVIQGVASIKLACLWKDSGGCGSDKITKPYRELEMVEVISPGFGFLGTCISLIFTMHHMDPNLSQSAMLKVLLENTSSAFGSTVYGISLAISAYLPMRLFLNLLIEILLREVKAHLCPGELYDLFHVDKRGGSP